MQYVIISPWYEGIKYSAKGLGIMRITITGRNIELTDGIKTAVESKLGKLEWKRLLSGS